MANGHGKKFFRNSTEENFYPRPLSASKLCERWGVYREKGSGWRNVKKVKKVSDLGLNEVGMARVGAGDAAIVLESKEIHASGSLHI